MAIATLTSLEAIRTRILARVSLRLNRHLSGEIIERLMARAKTKPGEPSTRQAMRDFDTVRQTVGGPAASALFDAPWTPLYLFVAYAIHPVLAWLIVGAGAVLVSLALINERDTRTKSSDAHSASAAAMRPSRSRSPSRRQSGRSACVAPWRRARSIKPHRT